MVRSRRRERSTQNHKPLLPPWAALSVRMPWHNSWCAQSNSWEGRSAEIKPGVHLVLGPKRAGFRPLEMTPETDSQTSEHKTHQTATQTDNSSAHLILPSITRPEIGQRRSFKHNKRPPCQSQTVLFLFKPSMAFSRTPSVHARSGLEPSAYARSDAQPASCKDPRCLLRMSALT